MPGGRAVPSMRAAGSRWRASRAACAGARAGLPTLHRDPIRIREREQQPGIAVIAPVGQRRRQTESALQRCGLCQHALHSPRVNARSRVAVRAFRSIPQRLEPQRNIRVCGAASTCAYGAAANSGSSPALPA